MTSYDPPVHLSVKDAMGPCKFMQVDASTSSASGNSRLFPADGPGKCDDKPFLHKRNNIYYLSWGVFYATSANPLGPYQYRGTFLDPQRIEDDFKIGNRTQDPWYTREDYADRHGSFVEWHGQWYFFANDRRYAFGHRYHETSFAKTLTSMKPFGCDCQRTMARWLPRHYWYLRALQRQWNDCCY